MKIYKHFISTFFVLLFLLFLLPKSVLADTFTLSGTVKDSSGTAVEGATVSVNDANSDSTSTDSSGSYTLVVPSGSYNVQVAPPSESSFSSAIAYNQNVSTNTSLNFVLTPAGTATLSGHVFDALGNPVYHQQVYFQSGGSLVGAKSFTDANGYYSITVSNGTYDLHITGNGGSVATPQDYQLVAFNYTISQSTIMDITIPAKKISIHVQDGSGNGISNVKLTTSDSYSANGLVIGGNITNAYGDSDNNAITDSSGDADLWLLPDNSTSPYTITATPPSGSGFTSSALSNIIVSKDTQYTITLQSPITLTGHVYDSLGNPVQNQQVFFQSRGIIVGTKSFTDSTGYYRLQANSGSYDLHVTGNGGSAATPESYHLIEYNYSLTQDNVLDITLPAKSINVHVQDDSGMPISGVNLSSSDAYSSDGLAIGGGITNAYGDSAANGVTDSSGNTTLWLFPDDSASPYTIAVTPPSGSTYSSTVLNNIIVIGDTQYTVTLHSPASLTGHVYDALGNPVPNQQVFFQSAGSLVGIKAFTDQNGYYTLNVASGTYDLHVTGNGGSVATPANYQLIASNYNLAHSTNLDITIPAKKVSMHVQDPIGNSIENVQITTTSAYSANGLAIGGGITNAYGDSLTSGTTDMSGDTALWLFPNDAQSTYTFTATPPSDSIYTPFVLKNISVIGDQTELVALQYNHAKPVTTAALSPSPFADGTYSDPTTVALSASASTGYTVPDGNTYYTIDGGAQQSYSSPFTVSGSGDHTVTYWSVDSTGLQETPKTKSFTIAAFTLSGTVYNDDNQNGFQDTGELGYQGATVTLNTGQSTTTDASGTYSFANLQPGTYTETLTIPQGYTATTTDPATVALSANTTQNFGLYSAPVVGAIATAPNPVQIDTAVSTSATFADGDTTDTHTAIWNWGDGTTSSGVITEPQGTTSGSVAGTHTYTTAGVYTVTLTVSDDDGASGTATYQYVSVYNPTSQGIFSAGQRFSSPAGAYAQNPSLTGTVKFGLSYKYSGTMPVGDRQFTMTFSAANLIFNATNVSSLVTANGRGTLTGTGTINGSGTYNYLVTGDENADTIRIKITDQSGNVIYDTQPGAAADTEPSTSVTGNVIVH